MNVQLIVNIADGLLDRDDVVIYSIDVCKTKDSNRKNHKRRENMKKIRSVIVTCIILLMILVGSVDAQQNLAQAAYAIFEQSCLNCHGENGAYTEALIIEYTTLLENGKVIPGDPDGSVVYQRIIETNETIRMPQNQPPLAPAAIETIRKWIAAGAPDWNAIPSPLPNFITTEVLLEKIVNHVNSLSARDKEFARYFTLTHLYNAGETVETLNAYRRALSKLINSLSWGREIVKLQPIDAEHTVFYIDLRHYEWDVRNEAWTQIEKVYPYQMTFDAPTQTDFKEKLTLLQQETNSEVPFVNVDWFIATASLPPLYNNILALPETAEELEDSLDVSVTQNLQNAPGIRVWRAGFNDSGVSRHNRIVERHTSSHGAYWKSYDFAGSAESQNIFTHPLDFTHDGGEIIFNLPNGLQAYFLVDGVGNRLDVAPTDIVSNPAASDPAVYNGLSCIGCHTEGMKTFDDEVRAVVEQADNPPYNKERALELYVQKTVMDELVEEDTQRYRDALEAAGGVFGGVEPVQRLHEVFQSPLSAVHAAATVGLDTNTFLERVSNNVSLQNLLGTLIVDGGTIKRDAWTSGFHDVVSELNSPDTVLPPVEVRPERIPGTSVHIPDINLRAALEDALGKAAGDVITVEDMEILTELNIENLGIQDITGLEYATKLDFLQIRHNSITDITPIAGLTQLTWLRAADNEISDIFPLTKLINLQSLSIYDNEISDITPLLGLNNLSYLNIFNNAFSDISPLSNLINLRTIKINVEEGGDLTPIAELINLEGFFYWGRGKPIPDLSPISNLPKLKHADIRGDGQPDLSPFARVNTLERFEFWGLGNNLPDLSDLAKLVNLKELWLINCGISDLTILENFTGLERLNLAENNISDVSPLAALTNLKWLKLTNNPITDISPLAGLFQSTNIIAGEVAIPDRNLRTAIEQRLELRHGKDPKSLITLEDMVKLKSLKVVEQGVKDLTGLQYATNLERLEVWDNQISDVSPLKELTHLRTIWLTHNQISDISALTGLINTKELYLSGNPISDLSPIENMRNLSELKLWDCPVYDLSPLAGLTELRKLILAYDYVDIPELVDITPLAGLTKMDYLVLHGVKLSDLSVLAGMINLKFLIFDGNNVSNVSPLSNLINLEHIITWGNPISNFTPLTKLTKLKTINICGSNMTDLSFLAGKPELTELYLRSNHIPDVSQLTGLTGITRLDLESNMIEDVSPLAELTNLEWLKLTDNPIIDFSPLTDLFENTNIVFDVVFPDVNLRAAIAEALGTENTDTVPITLAELVTLTTLKASNRDIKDLMGLEHAINLEEMWISGNPVSDLSPLAGLTNFNGLHAWETSITDLSPLGGLTKLRWLDFGNTPVSDLSPLEDITSLRKLTFYACEINDISPLAELTGLTHLAVGGNRKISDASPVVNLVNLEHLDFHHDSISDLQPLAGLTKLKYLNLSDNRLISDVTPLSGLTSLISLHLGQNMISDVSRLAQLTNLTSLELPRNMLTDVSPLAGLINLETLNLRENTIDDFSTLQGLSENTYIVMLNNPGTPIEGPTIEGPWLWMLVPDESLDKTTDLLAEASGGVVTEQQIATKGATEGNAVGDNKWTAHKISSTTNYHKIRNNMKEVLHAFGLSENDETSDNVLYGCIILGSPHAQETRMLVGGEGHHKIWLNGTLVYDNLSFRKYFDHLKYSAFFPVMLKQGANILLIAVDKGHWITGHFGFEEGTEYTLIPPGVGFSFTTTDTDNLLAGDTFSLNLNAENITDLAGWQTDFTFDPNVLEAVEVTEGDFLKSEGADTFFQVGTIDNAAGKITGFSSTRIAEDGVTGTGTLLSVTFMAKAGGETQVTLENFEFGSITGEIIPSIPANITITVGEYPAWDVNQDGKGSVLDLILVARDIGSGTPANLRTDVNRDGVINIQDLIIVAQHIGETIGGSAAPTIFAIDNNELTPALVHAWIQLAHAEDDGSLAFRQGIENLQKLLASFVPEKTALLSNYPNPFNPETWIPYHLAKPADVSLTIYDVNGAVVRTFALGHQAAGIYQNQSRAMHWDGNNEVGEPVASGIYFYTLSANDFTSTRKMLIRK